MSGFTKTMLGLFIAGFALVLASCEYDHPVPEPQPVITDTISFSGDIIPFFNASCNVSGCHTQGGFDPDLSPANAYQSIMSGNLVDVNNPESSELYKAIIPGGSMGNYGNTQSNAEVLAWIKQGALNN
jgi:hypothetical protein